MELITVEKDGERIQVHPLSLENHIQLGWKVVKDETAEKLAAVKAPNMVPPASEIPAQTSARKKK